MQIKEYLEHHQPIVYKTFTNALESNHLSHAYLLSGGSGMRLKESAIFLAKSILCDNRNPLACDECITCARIDEGNYADFMICDGDEGTIKKGDVKSIMDSFERTALESKGIMVYVLHLVETMTSATVNSILKFLEEPGKNVYAFLTTENESKVLPTILSRTQTLKFKAMPKQEIINDAVNQGVALDDAAILCSFHSDGKVIKTLSESQEYVNAKLALDEQLDGLLTSSNEALFVCQANVSTYIKDKSTCRLYLNMLALIFQDILNLTVGEDISLHCYDKIMQQLAKKLNHIDKSLFMIMNSLSQLDVNVNQQLLLDHVIYEITKEA